MSEIHIEADAEINKIGNGTIAVIVLIFIYFLIKWLSFDNTVLRYVGMEPFAEPVQTEIKDGKTFTKKLTHGTAEITPIADYKIYGRVYAKHYRPPLLWSADIFPYDISIGFGNYQHKEVYKNIKVQMASTVSYSSWSHSQYVNHLSKYFNGKDEIIHEFTNNHLCPANKRVRKGIKKLQKKDIVYIEGYLIKQKYHGNNGSYSEGTSSTTRNDNESFSGNNGSGSCEQIYVTKVVSRHGVYK